MWAVAASVSEWLWFGSISVSVWLWIHRSTADRVTNAALLHPPPPLQQHLFSSCGVMSVSKSTEPQSVSGYLRKFTFSGTGHWKKLTEEAGDCKQIQDRDVSISISSKKKKRKGQKSSNGPIQPSCWTDTVNQWVNSVNQWISESIDSVSQLASWFSESMSRLT